MYTIEFTPDAQKDLIMLQKKAPQALPKLKKILAEIAEHPRSGTGQAERLKHYEQETWSRRISREHRIVYTIYEEMVKVLVLSVFGHYK